MPDSAELARLVDAGRAPRHIGRVQQAKQRLGGVAADAAGQPRFFKLDTKSLRKSQNMSS